MTKSLSLNRPTIALALPLLLFLALILLAKSTAFSQHTSALSLGIIADLLFTIPLVYFLLIRKTKIPNTTVVPVLIIGVIIGSLIIPIENQYYLALFKTWALPFIELAILSFIIFKVRKAVKAFRSQKETTPDFFTALKDSCYELLPRGAVMPFATEVAVMYYGFISWRKRILKPNEFTHHKNSGAIALLAVFILIVLVETFVIHLLLVRWSNIVAWIFTGLSLYTAMQVWGIIKSIPKRPYVLENNQLKLRYGILNETTIDLKNIESIEAFSKSIEKEDGIAKLSPLGELESHNLLITLKEENTLIGLYGIKRNYNKLAIFVDQKNEFKKMLEAAILSTSQSGK
ncbi:hypothetical protein JKA74_01760 [Marivirga sp. S37H4]|uniref:Beta-carotene 15,15'-monooxygenase n=1 Tax=Marivirga aurantiaca TaxID=2802615 RepID=A0A934WVL8_9BACT|nr:hypothetical protein [Marivirga aurantiaca]MBK6263746.1 hypothetical protein [Marivirga aurantiaca]